MSKVSLLRGQIALFAVLLAGLAVTTTPVLAQSPWWHLSSGTRPATVQPGSGRDEVQHVTVSATGGAFALQDPASFVSTELKFDASATEVQAGLETLYGAGDVSVSGGPGDATGSKPYVVTFVGGLANRPVRRMQVIDSLQGGGSEDPAVSQAILGRYDGEVVVTAANLGDANVNGETTPVTLTDKLPPGFEAVAIDDEKAGVLSGEAQCTLASLSCTFGGTLAAYGFIEMRIGVEVRPGAATANAINEASVSGGQAPSTAISRPLSLGGEPVRFGVEDYELTPEEEGGKLDTQAGSHPFQLTSTIELNQDAETLPLALTKDLSFKLPPGLIGNPTPFPQCTLAQFLTIRSGAGSDDCAPQTAVGVARVLVDEPLLDLFSREPGRPALYPILSPLFNLEPATGEPARFGFLAEGFPVFLDTSVRTGGDYGVTVSVNNITQTASFLSSQVTFWGVPGDPRHDGTRGWGCLVPGTGAPCAPLEAHHPPPLLALPTSCSGALHPVVEADSWAQPKVVEPFTAEVPIGPLDGCNRLPFDPSISVAPDGQAGSTPTGLTVGVHVSQDVSLNPTGLTEADVKDTTVALPAGVQLSPAAADGLLACSLGQISLETPGSPSCPGASKIGTVEIKTPLLPDPLEGAVYLATQDENPFGSLIALYIVAEDPTAGVVVKLAGKTVPDPVTGQLVATFENTPQLPFEELKLHFFGSARAPLATPALCGAYTTDAAIAPWSGNPPAQAHSTFQIVSGPDGSPCRQPLPFSPTLTAGTTSIQAGGFSPFTMTMSRADGEQSLQAIVLHMPPGLLGTLASVKLCGEAQANTGTCGAESLIGHTTVSVGLGGDPYSVTGGQVFITGPYAGAPFGLSIVNPAKAGPFDLGKVVVRAKIQVDRSTSALTITTDDSGPYKIPQIIDGIPLQIKHVNVSIDRPGFTFNPTNCSPLALTGSIASTEGASAGLAVPFQATNCAVLAFKPRLTASTSGRTSRANGASLTVKLTYPAGPYDANIAKVKVELPKKLPSRLTTLQKACTAAVFEANPANCPPASIIGHATATTPVLPVPLSGPAYFVSHGGEAFPSLIVVLQGYGVTVDLVGSTFISKTGITSSTFKTVPDVPVGTFALTLPQGSFSALTANANLCKSKLAMPTEFVGQNGAELHTSTKIQVTGCPKVKRAATKRVKPKRRTRNGRKARARKGNGTRAR